MTRPFLNASIDELETALESAILAHDKTVIEAIADELKYRHIPRAKDLAQRIAGGWGRPHRVRPLSAARFGAKRASSEGGGREGDAKERRWPTLEQEQAIEAFLTGRSLRINAFAGTGKTSTLQMLSQRTPMRGQYLAFNKSVVADVKDAFASNVTCSTTHALAYRAIPQVYRQSKTKMTGRLSSQRLAEVLGLEAWRIDETYALQPTSQAYLILGTVRRFAQSRDDQIKPEHVPRHGSLVAASADTAGAVSHFALQSAQSLWARMCDPKDELPLGHDGYLKLWSLSRPQIPADFILLDEAQDASPVILDILQRQGAQLVYVGDRHQQIYEWRGAINAMEEIATHDSVSLTQSFRFGAHIASAASTVLGMLGESRPLIGNSSARSRVGPSDPDAIIARTNANVMTALVDSLNEGRTPHLVGGTSELMEMLRGVHDLKEGVPSTIPEFFGFQDWREVVEFSATQEGEHLAALVNLVESRGERQLMWALNRSVEEDRADLVLSTAHKAKGREWNNVRLMGNFLTSRPARSDGSSRSEDDEVRERDNNAELRLLYVALTRAREVVDIPQPLADALGIEVRPPIGSGSEAGRG